MNNIKEDNKSLKASFNDKTTQLSALQEKLKGLEDHLYKI